MAELEAPARPVRMCDGCGGVDDHPRHTHGLGPEDPNPTSPEIAKLAIENAGEHLEAIITQVRDVATQVKHMDCCRADGCPDGTCHLVTAGVEDLRGYDLVDHLVNRPGEVLRGGVVVDADGNPVTATTTKEV